MPRDQMSRLAVTSTALTAVLVGSGGVAWGLQPQSGTASAPVSNGGITPYIISGSNPGGNRTCGEVGFAYFSNAGYYQCYSGRINAENITSPSDSSSFANQSSNPDCGAPPTINVTDGTSVSFSKPDTGLGALIVKGSNDANTYVYDPQSTSDSGLQSPLNASGGSANLSNLTVCWNPDGTNEPCLQYETAWAGTAPGAQRYTTRGNWATWVTLAQCQAGVDLFAGQFTDAGDVYCTVEPDGTVTVSVELASGWQFANLPTEQEGEYDNNLKVQDYPAPPAGNPAPGLFAWKSYNSGTTGSVSAAQNAYYGIHADVAKVVACPE